MVVKRKIVADLPRSVASVVAESLEQEIIHGRLAPGERLVEADWAEQFGISRGSFREVLRSLANSNLVEIIPRRGARVAVLNKADLEEVYFLRKHLLCIAFERAADHLTASDCQELGKIVEKMAAAVKRSDSDAFSRLSLSFDGIVMQRAGLPRLADIMTLLGKPTVRYRYIGAKLPGRMAASLARHRNIVQAYLDGNGRRAGEEVFAVVEETGAAIIEHLFSENEEAGRTGAPLAGNPRRSSVVGT
jgi:DNA-binding GntR family transcriptional regulator